MSWIDKLVDNIKTIFVDLYGDQLRKPNTTVVECHFEEYFEQQIQRLEKTTLSQEPRAAESSTILEERPLVFAGSSGDEPPPLPGLLSRGWYRMLEFDDYANIEQDSPGVSTKILPRPSQLLLPLPIPHVRQRLLAICLLGSQVPDPKVREELERQQMPLRLKRPLEKNHIQRKPKPARQQHQKGAENGMRMDWPTKIAIPH